MGDLERNRHDRTGIVGQRRIGEQDQVSPAAQTADNLHRRLFPRKFAEVLLYVLYFQRALFELILRDVIFHSVYNLQSTI